MLKMEEPFSAVRIRGLRAANSHCETLIAKDVAAIAATSLAIKVSQ